MPTHKVTGMNKEFKERVKDVALEKAQKGNAATGIKM